MMDEIIKFSLSLTNKDPLGIYPIISNLGFTNSIKEYGKEFMLQVYKEMDTYLPKDNFSNKLILGLNSNEWENEIIEFWEMFPSYFVGTLKSFYKSGAFLAATKYILDNTELNQEEKKTIAKKIRIKAGSKKEDNHALIRTKKQQLKEFEDKFGADNIEFFKEYFKLEIDNIEQIENEIFEIDNVIDSLQHSYYQKDVEYSGTSQTIYNKDELSLLFFLLRDKNIIEKLPNSLLGQKISELSNNGKGSDEFNKILGKCENIVNQNQTIQSQTVKNRGMEIRKEKLKKNLEDIIRTIESIKD